jgi:hypothetical protein
VTGDALLIVEEVGEEEVVVVVVIVVIVKMSCPVLARPGLSSPSCHDHNRRRCVVLCCAVLRFFFFFSFSFFYYYHLLLPRLCLIREIIHVSLLATSQNYKLLNLATAAIREQPRRSLDMLN